MKFEIIVIAAAAMALSAYTADARIPKGPSGQGSEQKASQTGGDVPGDVAATKAPAAHDAAGGKSHGDAATFLSSIDRAGRDPAPRTRGATEVKGQNANGLGNVTTGVEVAGGTQASPASVSVLGSGLVETGSN